VNWLMNHTDLTGYSDLSLLIVSLTFLFLTTKYFIFISLKKKNFEKENKFKNEITEEIRQEVRSLIRFNGEHTDKIISEIPGKVLKSITSSTNVKKGALGELVGYLELKAKYDRIIPLGNIVDFIGIKFNSEDEIGHLDFIDVKTGKSARLSKDQKSLQDLIVNKNINFIKIKVESETKC